MNSISIILLLIALAANNPCGETVSAPEGSEISASAAAAAVWDYSNNGDDWSGTCQTGTRQSPIDLDLNQVTKTDVQFLLKYGGKLEKIEMNNNGKTLKVTPDEPAAFQLTFESKKYNLVQFHFHRKAEHTVGGVQHDLEVHLVHSSTVAGDSGLVVVGVLFKDGGRSDSPQQTFLDTIMSYAVPLNTGDKKQVDCSKDSALSCLQLPNLFGIDTPDNYGSFVKYDGSLTTPNCDEVVTWLVLPTPLEADLSSFNFLPQLGNELNTFRNTQNAKNKDVKLLYVEGIHQHSGQQSAAYRNHLVANASTVFIASLMSTVLYSL